MLAQVGSSVQLTFEQPIALDINSIKKTLPEYIRSAQLSKDKTKLSLTLARSNLATRSFEGKGVRGIDVIDPIKRRKLAKKEPEQPTPLPQTAADTPTTAPLKASAAAEAAAAAEEAQKFSYEDTLTTMSRKEVASIFPDDNQLTVERDNMTQGMRLLFPWKENRAAAIFARQNRVFAVFDTPRRLNLSKLRNMRFIKHLEQVYLPNATVLVITMDDNVQLMDRQQREMDNQKIPLEVLGYKQDTFWVVHFNILQKTDTARQSSHLSIPFDTGVENQKQFLWLQVDRTAEPIVIPDNRVGDRMIVVPIEEENKFISPTRNFVDFNLNETAQGVVIIPISDVLEYKVEGEGIRISSQENLNITQDLYDRKTPELTEEEKRAEVDTTVIPVNTIFPFEPEALVEVHDTEKVPFRDMLDSLYHTLASAPEEERSDKRFDIARFYFAEDMCQEALGVLRDLFVQDPVYPKVTEARLIEAACLYRRGLYDDAATQFEALEKPFENHPNKPEIDFWRWASEMQSSKQKRIPNRLNIPYEYVKAYDKFMQQYPTDMRYDFGLLAVEDHLDKGNLDESAATLEIISYDNVPPERRNDTEFLRSMVALQQGDYEQAQQIWKLLADDAFDRYNRARALYELAKYNLVTGKATLDQTIDELNHISVIWRGDKLELDVLKLAGQLYINDKRYYEGLRDWQALVNNFPNTKEALFIAGRMKNAFTHFFESGLAYTVSPFQALAMYFDFQELTPVGKRGDQIIQQLSDHFVGADLIDSAINLLDHQLRFRVAGETRNQLALKMSELYLANKEPQKAIDVLRNIDEAAAPKPTLARSHRAEARALMALNNFSEARNVIAGDFSDEAQAVRKDMFWRDQNWFGIMNIIEPKLEKFAETPAFPLKLHEAKDLLKLAVAYNAQKEPTKVASIRSLFLNRFSEKSMHDTFDFLTTPFSTVDYVALNATTQLDTLSSFMANNSFWPEKNWPKVMEVLAPYVNTLVREYPPLTKDEKQDVARLAVAYAMQPDNVAAQKGMRALIKQFPTVKMDNSTIAALNVFDDRLMPKEMDVPFTSSIELSDLAPFIEKYTQAHKISELNADLMGPPPAPEQPTK